MANKRVGVTLDINADISQIRTAATEMQKIFSSINLDGKNSAGITKLISNLDKALIELEQKSNTALSGLGDSNAVEKSIGKVNGIINSLIQEFQQLGKNAPKDLAAAVQGFSDKMAQATQFQKDYAAAIRKTESEAKDLGKAQADAIDKVDAAQKKYDATLTKQLQKEKEIADLRKQVEDRNKSKDLGILRKNQLNYQQQVEDAKSAIKQIAQEYENIRINKSGLINGQDIEKLSADDLELYRTYAAQLESMGPATQEAKKALEDYNAETARISKSADSSQKDLDKINNTLSTQASELDGAKDKLKKATEAINQFNEAGKKADAFDELKNKLAGLFGDDSLKNVKNIDELKNALEQLATTAGGEVASKISQVISTLDQTEGPLNRSAAAARKTGESFKKMGEAEQEINHLTSRLKYFFSLAGGFQLMRRAIRSAVDTTKELDAVMTQTAVVSDYSVGDMWKTLPQYSKYAKQLGAEIKDVYSAQTLYVQQGLNMNDAMDLGIETLKMARVAGIDAAEATNSMTAALRGFNMELTETSAIRINDVYSKLAQNTASNVQEISTAMSKVAALANSANMSFENTSAFLATIIESTREGAETAGTALKTVIARFTEVKKLYSEGELTGTDEEGQEVDVNKISAALRTAGINMNDFFTGAKGLDEIFMELGSKWDSLTTVQQRYIATMAAGSRQQSRFLALMQNYSRTVELTTMAYNSAGSGQEQFEKTLDSLEAKLNKLKAAWDTFTMGIANSDFIKNVIDTGTKILDLINSIINKLSGGNGLVKSILSVATAYGMFKTGGAIFKGGLGKVGELIGARARGERPQNLSERYLFTKQRVATKAINTKYGLKSMFGKYRQTQETIEIADARRNAQIYQEAYTKELGEARKKAYLEYRTQGYDKSVSLQYVKEDEAEGRLIENNQKLAEAKKDFDNSNKNLINIQATQKLQEQAAAMQSIGIAAGLAAAGCGLLANKLNEAGHTDAAKVFKGIATGLTVLATSFMLVGSAANIMSSMVQAGAIEASVAIESIPIIGWAAAIISALVAVGAVMANLIETPREAAERISTANEEIQQGAEQVKQSYEDLKTAVDNISKQEDVFDDLIFGTQEWDNAVQNLNQSILELIKLYPELAAAVKYTEEGRLYLDTESQEYKDYIEFKRKASENASIASEAGNFITNKSNKEGEASESFWEFISDKNQNLRKTIFDTGLSNYFSKYNYTSVNSEYFKELEKAINDGIIYNYESFNDYLKNSVKKGIITESQSNEIYTRFNGVSTNGLPYQYDKDIGNIIKGQQLRKDYEELLNTNLIQGAIKAVNELNLESSQFNNMYLKIAERDLSKQALSYDQNDIKNLRDKYKKEYAEAAGIKENKVDNDLLDSYIREQLAIKDVFKDNDFLKYFNTLDLELKTIASKIISGEEKTLTKAELGQVNQLDQTKLSNYTQIDLSKYEENYLDELTGTLTGAVKDKVIDFSDTTGQIENYTKNVEDIISRGGNVNKYFELLDQVINSIADPKKREEAKQLLSTTAATDADAIRSTALELQKLGAQIDSSLTNQIINATNAVAKFNLKNFEEQVKALEGAKKTTKDINEGKKIISAEDYNNLKEVFGTNFDESKWALGLDGYTYIGEETNSLLTNIDKAVGILVQNSIDQTKQDIEIGERIQSVADTQIGVTYGSDGRKGAGKTVAEYIEAIDAGEQVSADITKAIARLMGKDLSNYNFEDEDLFKAAQKALVDYYNDYYAGGVALEANYTKREQQEAYQNMPFWGKSGDYTRQMGGSAAEQISAYIHEATEAGLDLNVLDQYTKQLEETYNLSREMAMAIAYDNMIMNKGLEELISNYEAWSKIIASGEGTDEYEQVLIGLNNTLKKIIGTTHDFSREFLSSTENAKIFEKAAKGDTDAINQLRKAGAKDILNLDNLGEAGKELNDLIDNLDLDEIKIGATLDDVGITNAFQALLDAGLLTAEQVNQALESIGFEPQIEYEEMSLGAAKSAHQTAYIASPEGGMTKVESDMQLSDDTMVKVPIINGKGSTYKGGAKSTANPSIKTGGGGGGGGGNKEFKNDFDKYYNMVEDINELTRLRNLLESDYNQLLESESSSGKEIYDNLKKQVDLLKERRDITADLAEKRKQQILDEMAKSENADLSEYAWWNNEDQTVEINWSLINDVKDSELGDRIQEYVSVLEGFQSKYDEQIEALEEIESTLQEIEKRGRDQYTSLEDRVRDALIKQIQDKIDDLTAVDQAISEANQKVLDSISETLQAQRQDRENAKTEESLADKEQRLAYLRQDSSNANAVEIARLEKELAEERENYTDQLIDQKISELQKQNEEAQQQRQQQIDLMQESLNYQEKTGMFWDQVYDYINAGTDAIGNLIPGSDLVRLLKDGEAWTSLSSQGQMDWLKELEGQVKEAVAFLSMSRQLEKIGTKSGTEITFTNADNQVLTGKVDKDGNVVVTDANGNTVTYSGVYQSWDGTYHTFETAEQAQEGTKPATSTSKPPSGNNGGNDKPNSPKQYSSTKTYNGFSGSATSTASQAEADRLANNKAVDAYIADAQNKIDAAKTAHNNLEAEKRSKQNILNSAPNLSAADRQALLDRIAEIDILLRSYSQTINGYQRLISVANENKYKAGGLNTKTGLAWLDGTPSRPELVLNARDTENFIQLKDTLAALRAESTNGNLGGGDNYYDIDVHVDQMNSDYDVDRAIDRIKERIYKDGAYRNVNTLNRLR